MPDKILLIDDDSLILRSYERTLRQHFQIDTACGGEQALEKVGAGEHYAVILSDLRMPGMDGLQVLRRVHELSPESIRLILTGDADLRTAIDAVNEGSIFRFLEKPCSADTLAKVLNAALDQYRLVATEKDILEKTLHGTIKMLAEVLEMMDPEAFTTSSRITRYVKHFTSHLNLKDAWRFEVAAMLSQLGSVVLSQPRNAGHPAIARNLLCEIPRLEVIAGMVGRQQESFCHQTNTPIAERDPETLGAQILNVCIRFDTLVSSGERYLGAVEAILCQPAEFDPALAVILRELPVAVIPYESKVIEMKDLMLRMILDEDVLGQGGMLLMRKDVEVTEPLLIRLQNFHHRGAIGKFLRVLAPVNPAQCAAGQLTTMKEVLLPR